MRTDALLLAWSALSYQDLRQSIAIDMYPDIFYAEAGDLVKPISCCLGSDLGLLAGRQRASRGIRNGGAASSLRALANFMIAFTPAFRLRPLMADRSSSGLRFRKSTCMCPSEEQDWRAFRARLMQETQTSESTDSGYAFEYEIIEQGSIILGGTEQQFGFALRQQYFHKCVMLVLDHGEDGTHGIILNRPTGHEIDGWRLWFGGDVNLGRQLFAHLQRNRDSGPLRIICLHQLQGGDIEGISKEVIDGVRWTTFEGANQAVSMGRAKKSDFWVFVGSAGWHPGQLQREVDRKSWFLASVDSGTLLQELLREAQALTNSEELANDNGLATWETLMNSIGRSAEVNRTRGCLADRMLFEWCQACLTPELSDEGTAIVETKIVSRPEEALPIGSVLRMGSPSFRVLLTDQYLHRALLIKVHEEADGTSVAVVLNRLAKVQLGTKFDDSVRNVCFGGREGVGTDFPFDLDHNGFMWLGQSAVLGDLPIGTELGNSGLRAVSSKDGMLGLRGGTTSFSDFMIISGFTRFEKDELVEMLDEGEVHIVENPQSLWPTLWKLPDRKELDDSTLDLSEVDGTRLWRDACDTSETGNEKTFNATRWSLADEALAEWLKVFAWGIPNTSPGS